MNIQMKEIQIKTEEYWCSKCDWNLVHSDNPETGKFFIAYGHVYAGDGHTKGDYEGVVFAICTECLNKE